MSCSPTNVYLIEILKPIAYLPLDKYIQEASFNPQTNLFYIDKGSRGRGSVHLRNVKVLAQKILLTKKNLMSSSTIFESLLKTPNAHITVSLNNQPPIVIGVTAEVLVADGVVKVTNYNVDLKFENESKNTPGTLVQGFLLSDVIRVTCATASKILPVS